MSPVRWALVLAVLLGAAPARSQGTPPPDVTPAPRVTVPTPRGCVHEAICYKAPQLHPLLEEHRVRLYLMMALLPAGMLWAPLTTVEGPERPPLDGVLRRTLLMHVVLPFLAAVVLLPLGGFAFGTLMGAAAGVLVGAVLSAVGAVLGAIFLPIGGGPFGFVAGFVIGFLLYLMDGIVIGLMFSPILGLPAAVVPCTVWQLYLGPVSALRAWDRSMREHAATGQRRTTTR
ncbi:MAG: hypothetical protein AB2A00_11580 [Myxococcota bacterium]